MSHLYGEITRLRRDWYAGHPEARRRLRQPVISVGNLTVGGSGKTPLVAHLAELLLDEGERPAILSRGYGRSRMVEGVVVVRDGRRMLADLGRAGDEPLMLARRLERAIVLSSPDRYLAGRLAETRFGASMHILDDGFQHLAVERDLDLLVVASETLDNARPLPWGTLRELPAAAASAHAVIVTDLVDHDRPAGGGEAAHELYDPRTLHSRAVAIASSLGVRAAFHAVRQLSTPVAIDGREAPAAGPGSRVLAVTGIARPHRFLQDLAAHGCVIVGEMLFNDHHAFTRRDVDAIARRAQECHADAVMTTAKDMVRLLPHRPLGFQMAYVPMVLAVEPREPFRRFVVGRVQAARARLDGAAPGPTVARPQTLPAGVSPVLLARGYQDAPGRPARPAAGGARHDNAAAHVSESGAAGAIR